VKVNGPLPAVPEAFFMSRSVAAARYDGVGPPLPGVELSVMATTRKVFFAGSLGRGR